ncbi:LPS export ABC transporter periplasmic protein LptC [Sulfurimonas sp.]|uniref:LPS export ABC transporter periplasmic protein LptC n=1 Tax=Sulfurimonas sp. TaxID=2022749 RepID=UPI0025E41621|nr:LPS export ABC transporter periplasmic protein LptC [Sulfurimonas sp.]MBW6487597.1 LPS export ABC transporter periplasmic protein LptC [Sulfurimonas sp.]
MNINYFFIIASVCLFMILFLFKPLEIKEQSFVDVPLFSISSFTMYEFDTRGLITLMNGDKATRYKDRYAVEKIDYTDSSKDYIANMKSDNGIYKNEIVYLDGNIVYVREDGLTFETQKATYNKKTSLAVADGNFVLYQGENRVSGNALKYNSSSEKIESKNVSAKYNLKDGNK